MTYTVLSCGGFTTYHSLCWCSKYSRSSEKNCMFCCDVYFFLSKQLCLKCESSQIPLRPHWLRTPSKMHEEFGWCFFVEIPEHLKTVRKISLYTQQAFVKRQIQAPDLNNLINVSIKHVPRIVICMSIYVGNYEKFSTNFNFEVLVMNI